VITIITSPINEAGTTHPASYFFNDKGKWDLVWRFILFMNLAIIMDAILFSYWRYSPYATNVIAYSTTISLILLLNLGMAIIMFRKEKDGE